MEINPYESSRPGEPTQEPEFKASDPVIQLLMEIRDNQREMLQLNREALQRAQKTLQGSYVRMIFPSVIFIAIAIFMSWRSYLTLQSIPKYQPRPVPTTIPRTTPAVRP